MADPVPELLARGLELHRAGQVEAAEAAYREALRRVPGHPGALHLLGLARLASGDAPAAVDCLERACAADPADPQMAYNLGAARLAARRPGEAAEAFSAALRLRPAYPEASFNLGEALRLAGRLEAAVERLREARLALPGRAEVPNALGLAYRGLGRAREARAAFEEALALDATGADAEVNLGLLDLDAGDLEGALRRWEGLLARLGEQPLVLHNLAVALLRTDNAAQAVHLFRRAREADPALLEARIGEGQALRRSGEAEAARLRFEEALAADPASAEGWEGLGLALMALGREREAVAALDRGLAVPAPTAALRARLCTARGCTLRTLHEDEAAEADLREALSLEPHLREASLNLGIILAGQGRIPEAMAALIQAAEGGGGAAPRLCLALAIPPILPGLEAVARERETQHRYLDALEDEGLLSSDPLQDFLLPTFFTAYRGLCNRDLHAQLARILERAHPALTWMAPHCLEPSDWEGQRRLRVGFISRHFKNHSIGKTSLGLIRETDPARFERIVLSVGAAEDATARAIREAADRFVELPLNLVDARRRIAEERLDVLFYQDLGMETLTWLLAFARLAHVQCVSFGHPDTTGIPNVDWWVSSDLFEPEGAEAHYSERLHLLKDAGTLAYYYPPEDPGPCSREDLGLPAEGRLYVCPQTLFKLHPDFDPVLEGILRGDPGGRVVLLRSDITHWRDALLARFRRRFPDLMDRVVFLGRLTEDRFNGLLRLADAVLDTPHFNGMNSSLQAFAMGAPVVTWPREFQRGRHTRGMYARMGWMELVASSAEDYVRLALRLGLEPGFRARAVAEIEARRGQLFEDAGVVRQFEAFFEMAVRESRAPLPRDLRIAVVTPYHGESEAMLRKGHESVLAQTYPATHILVADGRPAAFVEAWEAQHLVLPVASRDNGHTPRAVGALSAIRQGFDALAYLDADNWLHPRHLEALVRHQRRTGADVVCSRRQFRRWQDDTPMPIDVDPTHEALTVDTGCHLFLRPAFRFQPLWSLMPRPFTPVGSRLVWNAMVESGLRIAFNGAATLEFRSQYAFHYTALGEAPPDIAKSGAWDDEALALHKEQDPELRALLSGYFPGAADPRAARWRCPAPIFSLGPTAAELDAVAPGEAPPAPSPGPGAAPCRDILLVCDPPSVLPLGAWARSLDLLRGLAGGGHRVRVAWLGPGDESQAHALEAAGAELLGGLPEAMAAAAALDLLWLGPFGGTAGLAAAELLLGSLRRLAPGPFQTVFDARTYAYRDLAPRLGAVPRAHLQKRFNALVRAADRVVYASPRDRAQALRFAGGEGARSHVVPPAAEPVAEAWAQGFETRSGCCLFHGGADGEAEALVGALHPLLGGRPGPAVHLYGLDPDAASPVVPAGLAGRVVDGGTCTDPGSVLARHRLLLLPEGLGVEAEALLLEGWAHGTPAVGPALRGLLPDAAVRPPSPAGDAFATLEDLPARAEDPEAWTALREACDRLLRTGYSPEVQRRALEALMASLGPGGKAGG